MASPRIFGIIVKEPLEVKYWRGRQMGWDKNWRPEVIAERALIGQISQSISQNGNFHSVESWDIHVILHSSIVAWLNIKRGSQSILLKEKYFPLQSNILTTPLISTLDIVEHQFQTGRDHAVRPRAFSGSHWRHYLHHYPTYLSVISMIEKAFVSIPTSPLSLASRTSVMCI